MVGNINGWGVGGKISESTIYLRKLNWLESH